MLHGTVVKFPRHLKCVTHSSWYKLEKSTLYPWSTKKQRSSLYLTAGLFFTCLFYVCGLVVNVRCKYVVWLLCAEDAVGACATAVTAAAADDDDDDDNDDDDKYWSNTIPDDAPSLLASCRRLSRSCGQIAVNNSNGQFEFSSSVAL